MPVISRFYGIIIKMFFGDHAPPHFHAEYNEHKVVIAIEDFRIIEGWLPPKALGLVIEWASLHKEELIENWDSLSENGEGTFKKIEPLK
jgi:hypothetical protein